MLVGQKVTKLTTADVRHSLKTNTYTVAAESICEDKILPKHFSVLQYIMIECLSS